MANKNTAQENTIIIGKATIIEQLTESTVRASLPNGKIIHAHLPLKIKERSILTIGEKILVKMNPYDFSRGRIIIDE
ncbi:MAG: translation initiation factor IF-1 [Verrucomicrobiota bacterium]|nr:translation initiation factor IF-1 [Verrucomicrobiota bacterium]